MSIMNVQIVFAGMYKDCKPSVTISTGTYDTLNHLFNVAEIRNGDYVT